MRKKILNIIGARPQIIKASAINRQLKQFHRQRIEEIVVHTGQHYDKEMSGVFFDEMGITLPHHQLSAGAGTHAGQTARIMTGMEKVINEEYPDAVIVYGDTNSTLAAALTAAKMGCPLIHIEAGMRSFNRAMPEEINRIVCDHLSTLLFTPTPTGIDNLKSEGVVPNDQPPYTAVNPGLFLCGDIMYDNALFFSSLADSKSTILADNHLEEMGFLLVTVHRDFNADNKERLNNIFTALTTLSADSGLPVVIPLHPRTVRMLEVNLRKEVYKGLQGNRKIRIIPPVSYLDMLKLELNCAMVLTDSGGVQKESHFFRKPCIILRPETEWVELVRNGTAVLADDNPERINEAYHLLKEKKDADFPSFYGDGNAAAFICGKMEEFLYF